MLPFLIDTGGNVLDLYSLWWFDDVAHFLNWLILVSAFALALQLTYEDTVGELALGGLGTLLGATVVSVAWRRSTI